MHAYEEHCSVEDYRQWDGDWELIGGRPYAMTPSPGVTHQRIAGRIFRQLDEGLDACEHGTALPEIDWEIANDTVVRPDVIVVCHQTGERIVRTPALVVEVVSASSARRDEELKFELYQREGVPFYLLVYPEKALAKIFRLADGRFTKLGDFHTERATLPIRGCDVTLDFASIWP